MIIRQLFMVERVPTVLALSSISEIEVLAGELYNRGFSFYVAVQAYHRWEPECQGDTTDDPVVFFHNLHFFKHQQGKGFFPGNHHQWLKRRIEKQCPHIGLISASRYLLKF